MTPFIWKWCNIQCMNADGEDKIQRNETNHGDHR